MYAPCINILWCTSDRSHTEPSLAPRPFVSPLEALNQRIYPPMLLTANPTLEDYEIFHSGVLNTTHTADNGSISQAQPPCSQPLTPHSFHVAVEHAVGPFHAGIQHRLKGSQLQPQDTDLDLSINTFALSEDYDMWLG